MRDCGKCSNGIIITYAEIASSRSLAVEPSREAVQFNMGATHSQVHTNIVIFAFLISTDLQKVPPRQC